MHPWSDRTVWTIFWAVVVLVAFPTSLYNVRPVEKFIMRQLSWIGLTIIITLGFINDASSTLAKVGLVLGVAAFWAAILNLGGSFFKDITREHPPTPERPPDHPSIWQG